MATDQPHSLEQYVTEWNALAYQHLAKTQLIWDQKVLSRLPLQGSKTVIDAGCGTGFFAAKLLERLPYVRDIAIDHSENMLQVAKENLKVRFGDRVTLVHVDLQTLQMDRVTDVIFSTATFH